MDRRTLLKYAGLTLAGASLVPQQALAKLASNEYQVGVIPTPSKETPLLLNFNENSVGMSKRAKEAVIASLDVGFRYPDSQREALIEKLASNFALKTENISLGNGSSENIQAVIQALIYRAKKDGKNIQVVAPAPTFSYAELYAGSQGVKTTQVNIKDDFSFDIEKMKDAAAKFDGYTIFYLCNPNNPTATITEDAVLKEWIKSAPKEHFFLIDEAYAELVVNPKFKTAIEYVKEGCENVAVVRTFSKLYALAGFRVGYAISSEENTAEFENFISIDNTNLAGAVAALASLEDKSFAKLSIESINTSRNIVTSTLDKLGLKYAESNANFIFHEVKGSVKEYQAKMKEHGVFVGREFAPITNYNRLTLGTPEEMMAFVKVLNSFRKKGLV
ncbi:MAG: histidinol-phosphate aminotransferase family protein [Campylobacteraceae bacterium]|nr:histidinol-phosphate aminotransferase family protein [Campylobacteraceae bacterium]